MAILADIQDEARRIVTAAGASNLTLRLLGGLAIFMHSPSAARRALARPYPDLDFAAAERRGDQVEQLLGGLGYEPNKSFNLFNGDTRLLFFDAAHDRQVDVFVGGFRMCHRIPIVERMALEPLTLPLAELFLTKMQVVQANEKDLRDLCALLIDHPFGDGDAETINLPRVARLCAEDWGLWKTVGLSAGKLLAYCERSDLDAGSRRLVAERLETLTQALATAPKSVRWRLRARLGERVPWYELPEEVQRG